MRRRRNGQGGPHRAARRAPQAGAGSPPKYGLPSPGGVTLNLRKHELIGLRVEVVDETRNMLVLEIAGEEKRIPKHGSRFRFDVQGGLELDGDEIRYRPEDRVKKAR